MGVFEWRSFPERLIVLYFIFMVTEKPNRAVLSTAYDLATFPMQIYHVSVYHKETSMGSTRTYAQ